MNETKSKYVIKVDQAKPGSERTEYSTFGLLTDEEREAFQKKISTLKPRLEDDISAAKGLVNAFLVIGAVLAIWKLVDIAIWILNKI